MGLKNSTGQSSATSRVLNVSRPPVNRRYTVLAGRMAAVCRGGRASIAAAMQFQHQLDGLGPGYDDSVLLGAACKRNHRFNDAVACGSGARGSHDVTILI